MNVPIGNIIIVIVFAALIIYFIFNRIKYSNIEVNNKKSIRLEEVNKIITSIEAVNEETEKIINSIHADTVYDEETINKLINYRDNEDKLKELLIEQRELEYYLSKVRANKMFFYSFFDDNCRPPYF